VSDAVIKNPITPQTTQVPPAGALGAAAAAQPAAAEGALFDGAQTSAPAGDSFTSIDTGASSAELSAQKAEVDGNNASLKAQEGTTQAAIEGSEATIDEQEGIVSTLTETNETLRAENAKLTEEIIAGNGRIREISSRINEINTLIKENSGFIGGLVNGVKNVFGNGVDVSALKSELAELKRERDQIQKDNAEKRATITANGGEISTNAGTIEIANETIDNTAEIKARQEAALKEIQEQYKNGEITSEQLQTAVEAALRAEAEERAQMEAERQQASGTTESGEGGTQGTDALLADALGNGTNDVSAETPAPAATEPSEGEIQATTALIAGALESDEPVTTETIETASDAVATTEDGDTLIDESLVEDFGGMIGLTEGDARVYADLIGAVAEYANLGLDIDIDVLKNASTTDLDAMVETALVQDVIKSTSTKVIGTTATFTSKKDMQKYSDSVGSFIDAYSALNSYYQSNNVDNLEANAFLSLCNDRVSKMNNGYVYSTSEVQKLTNAANSMMTTLMTTVSLEEATGKSSDTRFAEAKAKTDDLISGSEAEQSDGSVKDFRTEFLSLTSSYSTSDSDSEKLAAIKAMENLYQRALRGDQDVDKNPYKREINIAA